MAEAGQAVHGKAERQYMARQAGIHARTYAWNTALRTRTLVRMQAHTPVANNEEQQEPQLFSAILELTYLRS